MRKTALFVALAMAVAASPAMAAKKKAKKAPAEPAMTDWQKQNDNSARLVRGSLPIFLPSWAQPIYQGMQKNEAAADTKPAKKKKSRTKTASQS